MNLTNDAIKRDEKIQELERKLDEHKQSGSCAGEKCKVCNRYEAEISEAGEFNFLT